MFLGTSLLGVYWAESWKSLLFGMLWFEQAPSLKSVLFAYVSCSYMPPQCVLQTRLTIMLLVQSPNIKCLNRKMFRVFY